jgi:hypothetical protein
MAKGSHTAWDGMPRVCAGCGETLRITKDKLWLDSHARESWHVDCRPAKSKLDKTRTSFSDTPQTDTAERRKQARRRERQRS